MPAITSQPIPILSLVGTIVSMVVAIGTPIVLIILAMKKWKGKANLSSFFIGAGTFILFALILEQILHTIVLKSTGTIITGNIWLYALYGGMAAGIFEETGRFLAMKFAMRKTLKKENAIVYGIGHGGIEAILITGLSCISNIATIITINAGQLDALLAPLDETTKATTLASLSALWTTPSYQFFLAGMERISAIILHIALSYLVYLSIKGNRKAWFPIAILIHALVDAGTILLAQCIPVLALEVILLLFVLVLAFCIFRFLWQKDMAQSSDQPLETTAQETVSE